MSQRSFLGDPRGERVCRRGRPVHRNDALRAATLRNRGQRRRRGGRASRTSPAAAVRATAAAAAAGWRRWRCCATAVTTRRRRRRATAATAATTRASGVATRATTAEPRRRAVQPRRRARRRRQDRACSATGRAAAATAQRERRRALHRATRGSATARTRASPRTTSGAPGLPTRPGRAVRGGRRAHGGGVVAEADQVPGGQWGRNPGRGPRCMCDAPHAQGHIHWPVEHSLERGEAARRGRTSLLGTHGQLCAGFFTPTDRTRPRTTCSASTVLLAARLHVRRPAPAPPTPTARARASQTSSSSPGCSTPPGPRCTWRASPTATAGTHELAPLGGLHDCGRDAAQAPRLGGGGDAPRAVHDSAAVPPLERSRREQAGHRADVVHHQGDQLAARARIWPPRHLARSQALSHLPRPLVRRHCAQGRRGARGLRRPRGDGPRRKTRQLLAAPRTVSMLDLDDWAFLVSQADAAVADRHEWYEHVPENCPGWWRSRTWLRSDGFCAGWVKHDSAPYASRVAAGVFFDDSSSAFANRSRPVIAAPRIAQGADARRRRSTAITCRRRGRARRRRRGDQPRPRGPRQAMWASGFAADARRAGRAAK